MRAENQVGATEAALSFLWHNIGGRARFAMGVAPATLIYQTVIPAIAER
jgi:hypothetical protein